MKKAILVLALFFTATAHAGKTHNSSRASDNNRGHKCEHYNSKERTLKKKVPFSKHIMHARTIDPVVTALLPVMVIMYAGRNER